MFTAAPSSRPPNVREPSSGGGHGGALDPGAVSYGAPVSVDEAPGGPADPGAEQDPLEDAEEPLPRIPASSGALIWDRKGRLLILKTTYKTGWTVPGGVMEADGETPWEACRREVREECGLDVDRGRLVVVDFLRPRPDRAGGMRFLFDCGVLDDATLAGIVLQEEEIVEYRLARLEDALPLLSGPVRRRVKSAMRKTSQRVRYVEDGRSVGGH